MAEQIKKPFYKKWWFIAIVVVLVVGSLANIFDGGNDKAASNNNSEQKLSLQLDKTTVETDEKGKAKITGKTVKDATVSVGLFNSKTVKDDGTFSLTYKLEDTKPKKIKVIANSKGKTKEVSVTVNPSAAFQNSEAKKEDIRELSSKPTIEQETILNSIADQKFNETYPYKGSKMHALGVQKDWSKESDHWVYITKATVVNAFGAERDVIVEILVKPTAAKTGVVTITDHQ